MNDRRHDDTYYRDLQQRLRRLVAALEDRLPASDRQLVDELIGANECGLALETMSDALVEDSVRVDQSVIDEMAALSEVMGLPKEVAHRLRPPIAVP